MIPPPTGASAANEAPVQVPTPRSTLGELEAFALAMRAAGATGDSVFGVDIIPASDRRNAGFCAVLWGHPQATRGGDLAAPPPGRSSIGAAARPSVGAPQRTRSVKARWWARRRGRHDTPPQEG